MMKTSADPRTATLPDYLRRGLALVFVGINPGLYSVQRGRYFARPTNRFWPAFSRSTLSAHVRASLGREVLRPEDDVTLLRFGIGFTDVVKRPSRNAGELSPLDFEEEAPQLLKRLRIFKPRVACFHGLTAFRGFARYALNDASVESSLGAQPTSVGSTRLFVVPNPSPANAHFTLRDQISWYDRLATYLKEGRPERPGEEKLYTMDAEKTFASTAGRLPAGPKRASKTSRRPSKAR
jgi:TDG/mug DNA glycosylase family protein